MKDNPSGRLLSMATGLCLLDFVDCIERRQKTMFNQKNKKIFLFYISMILLYAACKKNPVPPQEMPLRSPREYTWTIDTLSYPNSFQTLMFDIWASSANNVYLVGHNSSGGGHMYYYNGKEWIDIKLVTALGGNIEAPIDLWAIYGFEDNDIWAVGQRLGINSNPPPNFLDSSLVIHFNGTDWFEVADPIFDTGRFLLTIWGISSSNLWAGGVDATLFHYDGMQWQKLTPPVVSKPNFPANIRSVAGRPSGEVVYMLIRADDFNQRPQYEYYYFIQYANNTFTIVDSDSVVPGHIEHKFGYDELWYSPWGVLYSFGDGLFEWTGQSWIRLHRPGVFMEKVYGTTPDNLFFVGHFGHIWHYNGSDWYQFKEFEPTGLLFRAVWTDGKEAFIIGSTGRETIVLHGK